MSRSWLPLALVAILVVAAVGILASGSQPAYGPVVETVRQGDFELTIRSAKGRYAVDEPIDVTASMTYLGPELSIQISHGSGSPMGFGIRETVKGIYLVPIWRSSCEPTQLDRGVPVARPFAKSGGNSDDEPPASVWQAFMDDPVLRLPAGVWHVYALTDFSVGDCGDPGYRLEAEIAITVESSSATDLVQPSPSEQANPPQSTTVRDGDFELTLRSGKTRYTTDEAIDVSASLVYRGAEAAVDVWGGLGQIYSRERGGEIVVGPVGARILIYICSRDTYERDVPHEVSIVTGRETAGRFEPQPVPRLPAGTWHLYATAATCDPDGPRSQPEPKEIEFALETEITIEVSESPDGTSSPEMTPVPLPQPSYGPDFSPPLGFDRGARDKVDDGTLGISIFTPRATVHEGDPVSIYTAYRYIGPRESVPIRHAGPPVVFHLEQLDATAPTTTRLQALYSSCTSSRLYAGDESVAFGPIFMLSGDGITDDWMASHVDGSKLRLPIGRWRVTALLVASTDDCLGPDSPGLLEASIDIEVAPGEAGAIELLTSTTPPTADEECPVNTLAGTLAKNPISGLGIFGTDGAAIPVRWEFDMSAELRSGGAVLYSPLGSRYKLEGEQLILSGTLGPDGIFAMCVPVALAETVPGP